MLRLQPRQAVRERASFWGDRRDDWHVIGSHCKIRRAPGNEVLPPVSALSCQSAVKIQETVFFQCDECEFGQVILPEFAASEPIFLQIGIGGILSNRKL